MRRTFAAAWFCATVLSAVVVSATHADSREDQSEGHGRFEFALIGDVPYATQDDPKFDNVIAAINTRPKLKWVLHAGDIKTGSSRCSDELFQDRLARFQRFEIPFVLTPGDNEWTDCHRVAAGQYQPLERLAKLREVFYPVPGQTLGQRQLRVTTQASNPNWAEFVEHMRWNEQRVVFATLHVVGSQNGLDAFDSASSAVRSAADDAEVARRIAASLAWIADTFAEARATKARGVLFLFQANPNFEFARGGSERRGFDDILAALEREAVAFDKPVALVHGDSHYFRVDKPLRKNNGARAIDNVTRVETFGAADVHWLRVVVDPRSTEVFSVHQEIVPANRR